MGRSHATRARARHPAGRAVLTVFDLDDTLFDFQRSHARAMAAAAGTLAVPAADAAFSRGFARAVQRTSPVVLRGQLTPWVALQERLQSAARAAGVHTTRAAVRRGATAHRDAFERFARPLPFARRAVAAARRIGPTMLLSNGVRDLQRRKLAWCGLTGAFDVELFSSETGLVKPRAGAFAQCERLCAVHGGAVTMVGDSYAADITPARRRGWNVLWIRHAASDDRAGPGVVPIQSLREVPAWLERWSQ